MLTARYKRRASGFTLVELLVVITITGILIGLLLPAILASREAVRRINCASNLRQVGLAMVMYCDTWNGWFPKTTHDTDLKQTWIYSIAPFMESVDRVRMCPSDLKEDERFTNQRSSYVLNSYITNETLPGAILNRNRLPAVTRTVVAFELTDRANRPVTEFDDHVEAHRWFTALNIKNNRVFQTLSGEVAVARHAGGANYLYADGRVAFLPAETIARWCSVPIRFVKPQDAAEAIGMDE